MWRNAWNCSLGITRSHLNVNHLTVDKWFNRNTVQGFHNGSFLLALYAFPFPPIDLPKSPVCACRCIGMCALSNIYTELAGDGQQWLIVNIPGEANSKPTIRNSPGTCTWFLVHYLAHLLKENIHTFGERTNVGRVDGGHFLIDLVLHSPFCSSGGNCHPLVMGQH